MPPLTPTQQMYARTRDRQQSRYPQDRFGQQRPNVMPQQPVGLGGNYRSAGAPVPWTGFSQLTPMGRQDIMRKMVEYKQQPGGYGGGQYSLF